MILIVNKGCYGWEWGFVDFLIKTVFKIKIDDDFWSRCFLILVGFQNEEGIFKILRS